MFGVDEYGKTLEEIIENAPKKVYEEEREQFERFVSHTRPSDPLYKSSPSLAIAPLQNPPIPGGMSACLDRLMTIIKPTEQATSSGWKPTTILNEVRKLHEVDSVWFLILKV